MRVYSNVPKGLLLKIVVLSKNLSCPLIYRSARNYLTHLKSHDLPSSHLVLARDFISIIKFIKMS